MARRVSAQHPLESEICNCDVVSGESVRASGSDVGQEELIGFLYAFVLMDVGRLLVFTCGVKREGRFRAKYF